MIAQDYAVEFVPLDWVKPSPENDDIYGEVKLDEQMHNLIASINDRGLKEPLIVSEDGYLMSGHRRYFALSYLEFDAVPIRREPVAREDNLDTWHQVLTEYNPQRVKSAGSLLKEALLRHADNPRELLLKHESASVQTDADYIEVAGFKYVRDISEKKQEFLDACIKITNDMRKYWPLTVRQVHYQLLNAPPLISKPKRSKFGIEKYRYRNDKRSYQALVEILKQARYSGDIPMQCIDDPTRPKFTHGGYDGLSQFVDDHMRHFLSGFHRNRQRDQPRHIEVLGEKNTLVGIIRSVCDNYYVPLTLGRGYATIPVWRDIARRFQDSGKKAMTLIVLSDYDPEGLDLPKDAVRSLRDMWSLPIDYHRVGVTREQVTELNLSSDFNPAKADSSRIDAFTAETGGTETWELEALPPDYLQDQLRAAIEANMDMGIYKRTLETEKREANEIANIRAEIVRDLNF